MDCRPWVGIKVHDLDLRSIWARQLPNWPTTTRPLSDRVTLIKFGEWAGLLGATAPPVVDGRVATRIPVSRSDYIALLLLSFFSICCRRRSVHTHPTFSIFWTTSHLNPSLTKDWLRLADRIDSAPSESERGPISFDMDRDPKTAFYPPRPSLKNQFSFYPKIGRWIYYQSNQCIILLLWVIFFRLVPMNVHKICIKYSPLSLKERSIEMERSASA